MINFSQLKSLTIPEGPVSRLLWGDKVVWQKQKSPPEGYTRRSYIESDGKQCINTGFIADANSKVVMDCQSIGVVGSKVGQAFFGARTSASSKSFAVYWHDANDNYRYMYGSSYAEKKLDRIADRIIITADKNVATIGDKLTLTRPEESFACEYPMFLFALNNAGSILLPTKLRAYSCQIYDGTGALVRSYLPYTNPDGESGLWDFVTGAFYANAGSGAFTYG